MNRSWWWILTVIALSYAAPARAQPPPDEAARTAARTLAETGRRRFEAGDYAGAIEALRDAERYFRAPTIRRLRAQAHEALGQLREAREAYEELAGEPLPSSAPPAFTAAREEARRSLASLETRIPRVRIVVPNAPAGTRVAIDGEPVERAALDEPIRLNPGKHVVSIEPPGAAAITRTIELEERSVKKIEVDLAPSRSRQAATAARPMVTALSPRPPAPPPASGRLILGPAIAFGAGGAGLIAGAVTGAMTFVTASDLRRECGEQLVCPPGHRDRVESARTLGHVSTVGFAVAGIGAAAGVVLLLWPGEKARPAGVGVVLGPAFLGVKGAF